MADPAWTRDREKPGPVCGITLKKKVKSRERIKSAKGRIESNHDSGSLNLDHPQDGVEGGQEKYGSSNMNGGEDIRRTLLRRPVSAVSSKQYQKLAVKVQNLRGRKGKLQRTTDCDWTSASQKPSQKVRHEDDTQGEVIKYDFSVQGLPQRISSRPPSGKGCKGETKKEQEITGVLLDHTCVSDHLHTVEKQSHDDSTSDNQFTNDKYCHDHDLSVNDDAFVSCFVTDPQEASSTASTSAAKGDCHSTNKHSSNRTTHSARQTAWGTSSCHHSSTFKVRPQSAGGGAHANSKSRLGLIHYSHDLDRTDSTDDDETCSDIRPSVYSLRFRKRVFGKEQQPDEMGTCLYKLQVDEKCLPSGTSSNNGVELNNCPTHLGRPLPHTLEPLREWIYTGADEDKMTRLLGLSPGRCLVFIPDLDLYDCQTVQEVPSVQHVDDDLPYIRRVVSPEPWVPKKYAHPYKPRNIPEWECSHRKTHLQIYSQDGRLLHKRYEGNRTIDVVRREITELENLIKGLGCEDSDCLVVQYQADITKLQTTIRETLSRLPLMERPKSPEPTDYCGLRKFYREHDEVMEQIRQHHSQCLEELARLEAESGLPEDQWHFSKPDATKILCS